MHQGGDRPPGGGPDRQGPAFHVKPLSAYQQGREAELRSSTDLADLRWRIRRWQGELERSNRQVKRMEKDLAKLDQCLVSQTQRKRDLRAQRDTRLRRRRVVLVWIRAATARVEELVQAKKEAEATTEAAEQASLGPTGGSREVDL